jgi:hypothetical protein
VGRDWCVRHQQSPVNMNGRKERRSGPEGTMAQQTRPSNLVSGSIMFYGAHSWHAGASGRSIQVAYLCRHNVGRPNIFSFRPLLKGLAGCDRHGPCLPFFAWFCWSWDRPEDCNDKDPDSVVEVSENDHSQQRIWCTASIETLRHHGRRRPRGRLALRGRCH